jgi:hypothetical protein
MEAEKKWKQKQAKKTESPTPPTKWPPIKGKMARRGTVMDGPSWMKRSENFY